ncbi:Signal transduction histidine kinase [Granulicella pectinivorans]|uniref:Signal transduction histidine kinase n=1 Tax=Granulicella pectinivorans TaxID=474950 RepID=A0A1I6L1A5_9BACT|nr:two-component regulator propeller domain-containing protein [Granulicella pectinivorans]SFR97000.1 Signal transduction histidine kinase [Granulicella pectinivorans]
MRPSFLVLCLAALALMSTGMRAQAPAPMTARVWHVQDGLTDQVIQAVVQGPGHLLWIGTPRGLLRFDGQAFSPYAGPGSEQLANGVTCLTATSDGSVYAGTEGAGLVRFHGSQVELLGAGQGITDSLIRVVTEDSLHHIWIGTDHGLFVGDKSVFHNAMPAKQYTNLGWTSVVQAHDGAMWAGGSDLLRIANGEVKPYKLPSRSGSIRVKAIVEDTDGTILVGAVSGLFLRGANDTFTQVPAVQGIIRMFGRLPSAELLVGTAGFGMYVRRSGRFERAEIAALPSETLLSSTVDTEGNSWIGTQSGLVRLSETNLQLVPLPTFTSDYGTISQDGDGGFWFCSNGVYQLRGRKIESYRFPWLGSAIVRVVMRDASGAIWIGTAGSGVFRLAPDGRHQQFTQEVGTNYIRGFLQARDGGIWIATDGGISLWKDGHIRNYHKVRGAPHTLVTSMFEDASGRLWVGTQRGLYQWQDGGFQLPQPNFELPSGPVWSVYGKADGTLWLGTNTGLFLLQSGVLKQVPLGGGQGNQAVFHIMESNTPASKAAFWISGPTQIMRVSENELLRAAGRPAPSQSMASDTYSVTDAFPSAELFTGMQQSGSVDRDGSAWFPSSLGPIHVLPSPAAQPPLPVPIAIRVLVDGNPVDLSTQLHLRAGTQTVQVEYAPVMLSAQSGVRFRQRLSPDPNWTAASTARTALYTGMDVGSHTYEVQAIDSEQRILGHAQFELYQSPYFYQRIWFWIAVLFALAAAMFWIDRMRIQRLQIGFHAVARERGRLAREMHDTLIQGCQAVSALLEAIAVQPAGSEESKTWLQYAREQIKATIVEARAAVWDLRGQDADESLEGALLAMTQQKSRPGAATISFTRLGPEPRLPHTITHELVMSAREALINALTHSAATQVKLHLLATKSQLEVTISDNGEGFSVIGADATHGRFGLVGMKERMARIGGDCLVSSAPHSGTIVKLTYPLRERSNPVQP